MMDVDIIQAFPFLLLFFFYSLSYVGVMYEFIFFCKRAQRPEKAWRHFFESFILIGGSAGPVNPETGFPRNGITDDSDR